MTTITTTASRFDKAVRGDLVQLTDAEIDSVGGGIAAGMAAVFATNSQFWPAAFVQTYLDTFARLRDTPRVK